MAVGDARVFPVLTQLFFPKPPTTFLTCFCRGERRKYAGKKSRLHRGSNSQPPDHESDTLTTEPPGRGACSTGDTVSKIRIKTCLYYKIHVYICIRNKACLLSMSKIRTIFQRKQCFSTNNFKLALSQTTDFADDDFKFDENGRKFSKQVENTV